jgi:enoyl-CoA hydratase
VAASTVRSERDGRVMVVTLDNPPRNFMNGRMVRELEAVVRELEDDGSVGAVILTGAHPESFVTHYDVAEIVAGAESTPASSPTLMGGALRAVETLSRVPGAGEALGRTPAAGIVELRRIHELFLRMNRMDKVFVAAINGMATGGGCELALACDIRLMSDGDFRIGLPETSVGLIPGAGGTQRLSRALGTARALEMILEARTLSPKEAEEVGLVHRVLPAGRLLAEARATASRLARRSAVSVKAAKRAVYEGSTRPLEDGLQLERAGFMAAATSKPAVRAMRAYADEVEKLPGDVLAPWSDQEGMRRWQEGRAVDMTAA